MLFATILGVLLGAAAALLIEQWLRAELGSPRPAVQPGIAPLIEAGRQVRATSITLRRLPPR